MSINGSQEMANKNSKGKQLTRPNALMQVLLFFIPWTLRRRLLSFLFGFSIAPTARIGFSLILAERLTMAPTSRIGHGTFINAVDHVTLGAFAKIGNFNWISGVSSGSGKHFIDEIGRTPELHIGQHASITARHFIDCCNTVTIGAFSTVAGARSQILTHAIDLRDNRQRSAPATIGSYCFVGTGCILLKGSSLPDCSVLAAGSTLNKPYDEEYTIYSGTPATPARKMDHSFAYFHRTVGHVS
jgi:acetyltransferase-like isoleucine patch superfamily enzyme